SVRISGISDDDDERCLKREINQRIPVAAQQRDQISDDSESAKDVYGGWNPRPPEQDSGAEKDVDAAEDSDEKPCPCKRRRKNGIARSIGVCDIKIPVSSSRPPRRIQMAPRISAMTRRTVTGLPAIRSFWAWVIGLGTWRTSA